MEKINLAKKICKTLYGLRFRTHSDRVVKNAETFSSLVDDYSKFMADPIFNNKPLPPVYAKQVAEAVKLCDKAHYNLMKRFQRLAVCFFT
ncbi:hypothetical protein MKW94_016480 [Papaver nudicaule]|nr:hypothetical protein [Papaver nudicaule]